jgi:hypothetical protein
MLRYMALFSGSTDALSMLCILQYPVSEDFDIRCVVSVHFESMSGSICDHVLSTPNTGSEQMIQVKLGY